MKALPKQIAGVDEAGRGPVIGPLVIAGVKTQASAIPFLGELGVRDSKLLSPDQREQLAREIKKMVACSFQIIQPHEIDRIVINGTRLRKLNFLEATRMAKVISDLSPELVYVDSPDVLAERFGRDIKRMLPNALGSSMEIIAQHRADRRHIIVGAASILAKVKRDAMIRTLHAEYGDFGSGYPHDPATTRFLEKCLKDRKLPPIVRRSWRTLVRVGDDLWQQKLV